MASPGQSLLSVPTRPRRRPQARFHPPRSDARERAGGLALLLALAVLLTVPRPALARELRRQMPYIRALLMGGAYTAVADESSVLLYNPAGLARLPEGDVVITPLHFSADRNLTALLLNPRDVQNQYAGLSTTDLSGKIGTSLYFDDTARLPVLYNPKQGMAFGIGMEALGAVQVVKGAFSLPALQLEAFADKSVLWSQYGNAGPFSFGITFKGIQRLGVDKTIDALTLFASGGQLNLSNDPDYQALQQGKTRSSGGVDMGMMFYFPGSDNWQPRIGVAVLNLGGHDSLGFHGIWFGEPTDPNGHPLYGEFPLNVAAGFAVSPTYGVVRYTFDFDLVDLTKTALDGNSLNNRSRVGMEIGIGPHADGTSLFSILFGWNAKHFSVGVLSRITIFEIGFGRYTVEKGLAPGQNPEDRRVVTISFRF